MPRTTRSQQRKSTATASPPTTVPSFDVSPVFSANPSVKSAENSPETSDIDEDEGENDVPLSKKVQLKQVNSKLRSVGSRKVISTPRNREITPPPRSSKDKGKQKAVSSSPPPASIAASRPRRSTANLKRKLEYDEASSASEPEEGSEFEQQDEEDDDEADEDIMMNVAIQNSFQTQKSAGGASSSKARVPTNPEAAIRAAAAERRIKQRFGRETSDADSDYNEDVDMASASSGDEESEFSDSEREQARPRAKSKSKSPVKPKDTSRPEFASMETFRSTWATRREERKRIRNLNKAEERALRKKLGRKLTHAEKTTIALHKHHPELKDVWGDVEANVPIHIPVEAEQPKDLKVKLLPFQRESLHWMREQEKGEWKGGMLADEMGMGKTIQIISLLVTDRKRPNLVIAPTVAVMQWKNELAAHTEGLKVLVWHGSGRESSTKELSKFDVVITTYAVLESCFRKQEKGFSRKGKMITEDSPLHLMKWRRIILDEAHNIKERQTNTAKACFELKSDVKWCLSGTPLQNRVGELYSLVRFLGGDPFSYYFCKMCDCKSLHWRFKEHKYCEECNHGPMQHTCLWNNEILTPIQKNGMMGPGKTAFKKLKILLDRMMLRRTKIQRADDLGLPPRTVIVRRDLFSPEEKELYTSLYSDVKRTFGTYLEQGTVLNNYSNIFSLLTRMRQMACHPDLVLRSKSNVAQYTSDAQEATVCRLCNDIAEDAIQAKCRHIFDRECIKQYLDAALEHVPGCPICHVPLTIDLDAPALELEENQVAPKQGILGRLNVDKWRSSSKIEALVEELSNLRLQDSTTKSIVFSQFVSFLDLIDFRLKRAGFNVCRLEGTMSPQARDATIQHFMSNVDVTVFLVSLKAGGVALNLTEASRVYLCDSWWNPAVEFQAMDRIHRLGQHRPVKAIKLVIEDSIESRIVQLQEKKSAMINATLSTDDSAMGRLTPEDLSFLFKL